MESNWTVLIFIWWPLFFVQMIQYQDNFWYSYGPLLYISLHITHCHLFQIAIINWYLPSYLAKTAWTSAYACNSNNASMRFSCILNKLSMGNSFMSCKTEIFIKLETIYPLKVILLALYLVKNCYLSMISVTSKKFEQYTLSNWIYQKTFHKNIF